MTEPVNIAKHQHGNQMDYQAKGMKYYLYIPPGDTPLGGWPIILFLHGIGEASQNYKKDKWVHQTIDVVKRHGSPAELCETKPFEIQKLHRSFIVISPQFPFTPNENQKAQGAGGRAWQWVDQADMIVHILNVVINRFNGNAEKIYATGFSRGGRGVLTLVPKLKEYRIAKLVLVDSESCPVEPPDIPTWVHYSGCHTFDNIVNEHEKLIKQLDQGIWESVPHDTAASLSQHLFTNWNLTLSEPTQNHTETSKRAYSDPWVYEWLLEEI